ncbi:S41 family peptidase [Neotamlana laminarinivorans]|uniref:Peptidase S41 n=1 Tax=Neotamlana laminarinivorans TaxID=2883124 RepID=A0A9X1HZ32_9FLAO|nr:S41 family peptidase [Tamlana laminarinivorans]MCB4798769.1 peptidase S41 [Tamlana laminarinivorans]
MKHLKLALLLFAILILATSCFEDGDDVTNPDAVSQEVKDFVWKGMNVFYLYKENIPDLANDRFTSNDDYVTYLESFDSPEALFENLIYDRKNIDLFSWITDDYIALEASFSGITNTNGMEFSPYYAPNSSTNIIGAVRLVLPNTDAELNGVERGDIIYGVDGNVLTTSNYIDLLNQDSYTINLGTYNDNNTPDDTSDDYIADANENIALTKSTYTENPVHTTKILTVGGQNVGYLLYNGFTYDFNNELNEAFAEFKANNVQQLVLDLRYNPGGRVSTETFLASMITGQFTGEVFQKLVYNDNFTNNNYSFSTQLDDGSTINSLNLSKVYILATDRSASASEGLINGLAPYIEVIHIGSKTVGKTQGSITIYDSADFDRTGANQNHTYAMQPLVANGVNVNDVAVPSSGLEPTSGFEYTENPYNYGSFGDENEPMLAIALADIENSMNKVIAIKSNNSNIPPLTPIKDINNNTFEGGMIID